MILHFARVVSILLIPPIFFVPEGEETCANTVERPRAPWLTHGTVDRAGGGWGRRAAVGDVARFPRYLLACPCRR